MPVDQVVTIIRIYYYYFFDGRRTADMTVSTPYILGPTLLTWEGCCCFGVDGKHLHAVNICRLLSRSREQIRRATTRLVLVFFKISLFSCSSTIFAPPFLPFLCRSSISSPRLCSNGRCRQGSRTGGAISV
ncbi:hypothetical protein SUGI_0302640 [Cryptomeria japonica]|nr:hypothetical protein SUGI_0302640 [Cryptomeria japonica]